MSAPGIFHPTVPVETMPPVVPAELPCLIDASISGDRVHLECARGYIKDL